MNLDAHIKDAFSVKLVQDKEVLKTFLKDEHEQLVNAIQIRLPNTHSFQRLNVMASEATELFTSNNILL